MSQLIQITEGEVDFHVPAAGKPCKTWYKIIGNLDDPKRKRPLVVLHGGPGMCHSYMLPMAKVWETQSIPVILYDQIGNGKSTHLPEKKGDESFWTEELFRNELENLLRELKIDDDYDIIGQSWGGTLGAAFATYQPKGLKKLIIANSPASVESWVKAYNNFRLLLPEDVQATLSKHEKDGTFDSKEYEEAMQVFHRQYVCRVDPWPKELSDSFEVIAQDPTVSMTMNGPSEFCIAGSLKTWSIVDRLRDNSIQVPTLVINGKYDGAQDEAVLPFFNYIPRCKWVKFDSSSHLPHFEEPERFFEVLEEFLMRVQPYY